MEVKAGRRDIYTRVPAICFISCILSVNEHKMAQPSSCRTATHFINEECRDEI